MNTVWFDLSGTTVTTFNLQFRKLGLLEIIPCNKCQAGRPLGSQAACLFPWSSTDSLRISVLTRLVSVHFPLQHQIRQYFPFYSSSSLYKEFLISLYLLSFDFHFLFGGFCFYLSEPSVLLCLIPLLGGFDLSSTFCAFSFCFSSLHSLCLANEVTFYGVQLFFSLKVLSFPCIFWYACIYLKGISLGAFLLHHNIAHPFERQLYSLTNSSGNTPGARFDGSHF